MRSRRRRTTETLTYIVILALGLLIRVNAFDLNEMPDVEEDPVSAENVNSNVPEQQSSKIPAAKPAARMTRAQYAKVLALFNVLKVCDSEEFDLNGIKIPDGFSKENKAMMALKEVAKRNLIAKPDKARYARIMQNCLQLSKMVQERNDQILSQDSGGDPDDWEAQQIYKMRNSPLDNFKDRFSANQRAAMEAKSQILNNLSLRATTTTTPTPAPKRELVDTGNGQVEFISFL